MRGLKGQASPIYPSIRAIKNNGKPQTANMSLSEANGLLQSPHAAFAATAPAPLFVILRKPGPDDQPGLCMVTLRHRIPI